MLVAGRDGRGKHKHKITTRREYGFSLFLSLFERDGVIDVFDKFVSNFFDFSFEA